MLGIIITGYLQNESTHHYWQGQWWLSSDGRPVMVQVQVFDEMLDTLFRVFPVLRQHNRQDSVVATVRVLAGC